MAKKSTKKGTLIEAVAKKEEKKTINKATETLVQDIAELKEKISVHTEQIKEIEETCVKFDDRFHQLKLILQKARNRLGI